MTQTTNVDHTGADAFVDAHSKFRLPHNTTSYRLTHIRLLDSRHRTSSDEDDNKVSVNAIAEPAASAAKDEKREGNAEGRFPCLERDLAVGLVAP